MLIIPKRQHRSRQPGTLWPRLAVLCLGFAFSAALAGEDIDFTTAANNVARALAGALSPYRERLQRAAQDPRVVMALVDGDAQAREALAAELLNAFDNALSLRIVTPQVAQMGDELTPPLTYASLQLFRTYSANRAPIPAEVHLPGTDDEHLVMIERVRDEERFFGFLHLSLATEAIFAAAAGTTSPTVFTEIRQQLSEGAPVVLMNLGHRPETTVAAGASDAVPGTTWVVHVQGAGAAPGETTIPWTLLGAAAALAAVAVLAVRRFRRPATARAVATGDTTVYGGAIQQILDGELPDLAPLLPGVGSASERAKVINRLQSEAAPAAAELTTVTSADELEIRGELEPAPEPPPAPKPDQAAAVIDPVIFRGYDIRGIVDEALTEEAVYHIGRAIGTESIARDRNAVVVAQDGRTSSPRLVEALIKGLLETGCEVLHLGLAPTPVLYFATHYLDARTGVMVTGSHNSADYNGLKIVLDGETLCGEAIQAIRERTENQVYHSGNGVLQEAEIIPDYIRQLSEDIPLNLDEALKVVVDCGNGVAGLVAPHVLRALGHDVIELHCELDGSFPNHQPDPSQPKNLADLIATVVAEAADIGLAFDGDGDRLGVVDRDGTIIWPDRQMMLFARDILAREPGAKVIYDVKCSSALATVIVAAGGEPIMWKTGHSVIKAKMVETEALLAGDFSGHFFFKDRWFGFDDGFYAAARLLEILVNADVTPEDVFAELPETTATPELRIEMPELRHQEFMAQLIAKARFEDGDADLTDGLRVDFRNGWGLVRPSNTTPCLVARFEGEDDNALAEISGRFRDLLLSVDSGLTLPF